MNWIFNFDDFNIDSISLDHSTQQILFTGMVFSFGCKNENEPIVLFCLIASSLSLSYFLFSYVREKKESFVHWIQLQF